MKSDGSYYEPSTYSAIHGGIRRYLQEHGSKYDISDKDFQLSLDVLSCKKRQAKASGKGNKPNKAQYLSEEQEGKLWEAGELGHDTPQSLQNTIWFVLTKLLGFRGSQESRDMRWGDFNIKEDDDGDRFVEFTERATKTRTGQTGSSRVYTPTLYSQPEKGSNCPVWLFEKYAVLRPPGMCDSDSPFFLAINHQGWVKGQWYKKEAMGRNTIGKFLSGMCQRAGIVGRYSNHSLRRSSITDLLQAGFSPCEIAQYSGHKNLNSINEYAVSSIPQRKNMQKVLTRGMSSAPDLQHQDSDDEVFELKPHRLAETQPDVYATPLKKQKLCQGSSKSVRPTPSTAPLVVTKLPPKTVYTSSSPLVQVHVPASHKSPQNSTASFSTATQATTTANSSSPAPSASARSSHPAKSTVKMPTQSSFHKRQPSVTSGSQINRIETIASQAHTQSLRCSQVGRSTSFHHQLPSVPTPSFPSFSQGRRVSMCDSATESTVPAVQSFSLQANSQQDSSIDDHIVSSQLVRSSQVMMPSQSASTRVHTVPQRPRLEPNPAGQVQEILQMLRSGSVGGLHNCNLTFNFHYHM